MIKKPTFKHLFLLPLITTLISCGASSKEDGAEEGKPKVKYEFGDDKTLLWEITGNGLKTPSYLYGTIHIQNARVFAYDTIVAHIFNGCDAYAMELNMDDMKMAEMMKFMMMEKPIDSFV